MEWTTDNQRDGNLINELDRLIDIRDEYDASQDNDTRKHTCNGNLAVASETDENNIY